MLHASTTELAVRVRNALVQLSCPSNIVADDAGRAVGHLHGLAVIRGHDRLTSLE